MCIQFKASSENVEYNAEITYRLNCSRVLETHPFSAMRSHPIQEDSFALLRVFTNANSLGIRKEN